MAKIFLSGGGTKEASYQLDKLFYESIPNNKKMLYIPIAMEEERHPYPDCFKWIKDIFKQFNYDSIEMLTDLNLVGNTLKKFGAVYIGGGNSFKLMHELRSSGFDVKLKKYIQSGGIVYGGSAGAIILGKSIATSTDKNLIKLKDLDGLNLVNGYSVFCHYDPKDNKIISKLSKMKKIIAIPEGSGAVVDNNHIRKIGMGICFFPKLTN